MSISLSSLKIFAVKLESCRKKRTKFWTFFAVPNFKGGAVPPSFVLALTPQPRAASSEKVSWGYTP